MQHTNHAQICLYAYLQGKAPAASELESVLESVMALAMASETVLGPLWEVALAGASGKSGQSSKTALLSLPCIVLARSFCMGQSALSHSGPHTVQLGIARTIPS